MRVQAPDLHVVMVNVNDAPLADSVRELALNPQLCLELGRAAREHVRFHA